MKTYTDFKSKLSENSLYTDQLSKDALSQDKEKLMDSLMFNYFGFLGFVALGTKGGVSQYDTTEGPLDITKIGDDNNDASLSLKMALDAGMMTNAVALQMSKLLILVKSKKVDKNNLDDTLIRKFLDDIHYTTHKPSAKVLSVMKNFHDNVHGINQLAYDLSVVSKLPQYKEITIEFRKLASRYKRLFDRTGFQAASTLNHVPAANIQAQNSGTHSKPVMNDDFYIDLYDKNSDIVSMEAHLSNNNVDLTDFDIDTFTKCLVKNIERVTFPKSNDVLYELSAFLDKVKPDSGKQLIGELVKEKLDKLIEEKDVRGFISLFKEFDGNKLLDNPNSYSSQIQSLLWRMYSRYSKNIPDGSELSQHKRNLSGFIKTAEQFLTSGEIEYIQRNVLGTDFTLDTAIAIVVGYDTSDWNKNLEQYFNKAFGVDACTESGGRIELDFDKFDAASKTLQDSFQLLVDFGVWGAKIVKPVDDAEIVALAKHIVDNRANSWGLSRWSSITAPMTNADEDKTVTLVMQEPLIDTIMEELAKGSPDIRYGTPDVVKNVIYKLILKGLPKLSKVTSIRGALDTLVAANFPNLVSTITSLPPRKHNAIITAFSRSTYKQWFETNILNANTAYQNALFKKPKILILYIDNNFSLIPADTKTSESLFSGLCAELTSDISRHNNSRYLRLLLSANPSIAKSIVSYYESNTYSQELIDAVNYTLNSISPDKHIKFLQDSDITQPIIDNYIAAWKVCKPIESENYKFSKQLYDAYNTYLKDTLKQLDVSQYPSVFKLLTLSGPDAVSDFFASTSQADLETIFFGSHFNPGSWSDTSTVGNGITDVVLKLCDKDYIGLITPKAFANLSNMLVTGKKDHSDLFSDRYSDGAFAEYYGAVSKLYALAQDPVNGNTQLNMLDGVLSNLDISSKGNMVGHLLKTQVMTKAEEAIYEDACAIKPLDKLDGERIINLLKYNDVHVDQLTLSSFTPAEIASLTITDIMNKKDISLTIEELYVDEVATSDEKVLDAKSVEYDDLYNKGATRGGDCRIHFQKHYTVSIPKQVKAYDAWVAAHPGCTIKTIMFHGTGSIAASFILRYGFKVIPSSDPLACGRMYGDGIYCSNTIDKAGSYAHDGGSVNASSLGRNPPGYMFVIDIAFTKQGTDYNYGVSNAEEWVLFSADQVVIREVYELQAITNSDMIALRAKVKLNEGKLMTFNKFLTEAEVDMSDEHLSESTFTFVDGQIPVNNTQFIDFDSFDVKKYNGKVKKYESQNGFTIAITHPGHTTDEFRIRYTSLLYSGNNKVLKRFLNLLKMVS